MTAVPRFTNRLVHETSPYLRQHAHNPVDWFPWSDEALARAAQLDRPIFLSIGYSACHWCHVMEHESFENDDIAKILNEHFISIKVDREERPDLDQIYMASVQMMSGHGGWPMSVFLTPQLKPFTGGTYFPPDDRYGRPGFKRILLSLAEAWRTRREDIESAAGEVSGHLQDIGKLEPGKGGDLTPELLRHASRVLQRAYDPTHGGFGKAPKFLHTMDLRVLLRVAKRFDEPANRDMVTHTLTQMAMGGLYDHLGGGFARYSTDERWLAPHFEKMLYDNALMIVTYLEAYQATKETFFREIVVETLEWVRREMTSPEGPFYSTLDADSEGEEGKFYVWTAKEIEDVLGTTDAPLFNACYGVADDGNWDDPHDPGANKNILHRTKTFEQLARMNGFSEERLRPFLAECRAKLFAARARRVRPGLDDKALTAWNGLMITACATAAQVLDEPAYAQMAVRAAEFILSKMRTKDRLLMRTWSRGHRAKLNGYLEDYAYLLEGLMALYETTFEPRWIGQALELAELMIAQFWDDNEKGFFFTGRDHEKLIARTKDPHDNATPSANAVATTAILRLVRLSGRNDLMDRAEDTLRLYGSLLQTHPHAAGQMLIALDFYLGSVVEYALVGDPACNATRRVLQAIHADFRPNKVIGIRPPVGSVREDWLPLLAGKYAPSGEVTLYVCENFACQEPAIGVEAAEAAVRKT